MGMGKFLRLYFDGYALPSLTPQNRVAPLNGLFNVYGAGFTPCTPPPRRIRWGLLNGFAPT